MDSKLLCVSLLIAVFCLWSVEAGSWEEAGSKYDNVENERSDDTRAAINAHTTQVASTTAKKLINKAKATEGKMRFHRLVARDRFYYADEYNKLAEDARMRSQEASQMALADSSRVGPHAARQREWNTQVREAKTMADNLEQQAQNAYTKSKELRRQSIVSYSQAAMYNAQATGTAMRADRASEMAKDLKRIAELIRQLARSYYNRGKEDQARANSDKVGSNTQAQDSQRHFAVARAYEQEALRTRMASRTNILKYMQNSLLAEHHQNVAKQLLLKHEMENKVAQELFSISEKNAAMEKVVVGEIKLYGSQAKHDETKAYEYGESKKIMGSEMADASEMLSMAQAKDDSSDDEGLSRKLTVYPAEDPLKSLPSEEKNPMLDSDEGLN